MADDQPMSRVDNDVAYLARLSEEVLEITTPFGRQTMVKAAETEDGRAILHEMLTEYRRWHQALIGAANAIAAAHADAAGALAGEPIHERVAH